MILRALAAVALAVPAAAYGYLIHLGRAVDRDARHRQEGPCT